MNFRTIIDIKKQEPGITYSDQIMMTGSCFTENIGAKLQKSKFLTLINPTGILYNPESIRDSISRILEKQLFCESEIFEHEGVWKSFGLHSRFAAISPTLFLENINKTIEESHLFLKNTDILIITFGTAWVYRLAESGKIAANCHKQPSSLFIRERLPVNSIVADYIELIQKLLTARPDIKLIFTVSPIRHLKDGAQENQLSKATLLLAIEQLQCKFSKNVIYFPAYEIVMDELRDYRFYAEDMIHPNETAINYIWECFSNCFFSKETNAQKAEIEKLISALQHRPFQAKSKAFLDFINKNLRFLNEIEKKYPHLDFKSERIYFESFK